MADEPGAPDVAAGGGGMGDADALAAAPGAGVGSTDGTAAQSDSAVVEVRRAGGRVYTAFIVGAAAAVFGTALLSVFVLAAGFPATAAKAGTTSGTFWRVVYSVLVLNLPRSVMVMGPFAMTFVMDNNGLLRRALVVAAAWAVFLALVEAPTPGSESTVAVVLLSCAAVVNFPLHFVPLLLVRGLEKREDGSTRTPALKATLILGLFVGFIALLLDVWIRGAAAAWFAFVLVLLMVALRKDTLEKTHMDEWYILGLVMATYLLPFLSVAVVAVLVDNLDQTDPLESLATASVLSVFIFLYFQLQFAFARRGLPARHRTVALFPLQVFEDVFAEFFFANARVYSGGFFVLLAVQIARTLGRDTGAFNEATRRLNNLWRRCRGEPPVPRADDAVVDWTRIWLQNMVSELTAMFVFVGAIAGEEAQGNTIGPLTGLDQGGRIALLGGYGVVFLFEAAAHVICFFVLRRTVQMEQARIAAVVVGDPGPGRRTVARQRVQGLSIGREARELVEQHGPYLLASLLAVTLSTLYYARNLQIDYD